MNKAQLIPILSSLLLVKVDESQTKASIIDQIMKAQEASGGIKNDLIVEESIEELKAGENEIIIERIHNGQRDRIVVSKDLWANMPEDKYGYEIVVAKPAELTQAPATGEGGNQTGTSNEGAGTGEGNAQ